MAPGPPEARASTTRGRGLKRSQVKQQLRKLHEQMAELTKTGLNERAIVVLLQDATGLPKRTIRAALDGLEALEALYTDEEADREAL